ncbi:histidine phosphatase family protein [Hamadaea flava]|uniref:Histidine phosphatase family protein n=1 Tax=Hamadaea flava TaxID=1742688 RepID=A0ABV8LUD8_9ACTN|nr:histidine phosphatase family protein [Hamadaea flava]
MRSPHDRPASAGRARGRGRRTHRPYAIRPQPRRNAPRTGAGFFDGYDATEAASGRRLAESLTARFATAPRPSLDTHEDLVTHAHPIAWLVRYALDAPPTRWLDLNSANTALTLIEYRTALPQPSSHSTTKATLPPDLRWTGFPSTAGP